MAYISLVIITYNQGTMIQNCLNSILLSQTADIELVISDDCSVDNTAEEVNKWIELNKSSFESVQFLCNSRNVGTVKNVVQAVNASHANYIKTFAGDDWFLPGAIDSLRNFCKNNMFDVAFASMRVAYQDEYGCCNITNEIVPASRVSGYFNLNYKEQFVCLTKWCCLPAPANLFTRHYWDAIELDKADISIAEDWYMWIAGAAKKLSFKEIPQILVVYRKHAKSVSRNLAHPRTRKGLRDVAWVLWHIGFSRKEWLSLREKCRLLILCSVMKISSMFPISCIVILDNIRRKYGSLIYKRNFQ